MALAYSIRHAFNHEGTYYTASNAEDVKTLSRAARDELIELGFIVETDDRKNAAEPAAPASTKNKAGS